MRNLAIIPARSGSKGLKDKNIKILNGKPLIAYTIEAAQKSGMFDEIMVSTDSDKYAKIVKEWGASIPFLRSYYLAEDMASSWDVVKEVIKNYTEIGKYFDTVALLQPTSPLRTSKDIISGYEIMESKLANAVVAVCEMDHSPLWSNVLTEDLSMDNFIDAEIVKKPRQSLPQYYRINGALYIVKTNYLMNTGNIYSTKSYATIMKRESSIDIDNKMDFIIAELIMNNKSEE